MIAEKRQAAMQPVLILGPTGEAAVGFKDTSKVPSLSRANSTDSSCDRIKAFPGESLHHTNSIQLAPVSQQLSPFQLINETPSNSSSSSSSSSCGGNPFAPNDTAHSPSPFDDSSWIDPNEQQGAKQ
jgi:hypothetical protein